MKAMIIGGGLGGLLSAAKLARSGYEVEVFERLPMIGGRFTNIDYKGFQLSTGALHMIPHGPGGPLAQILKEVGADVEIVRSKPMAVIRIPSKDGDMDYKNGYKDIPFNTFATQFSAINRLKIPILTTITKMFPPKKGSFEDWYKRHLNEDWTQRIADAFCGWSLSLRSSDVSAEEVFSIFSNLYRYSGCGVPMEGCRGVVNALSDVITSNGGIIHTKSEVDSITVIDGKTVGVVVDGIEYPADLVISNIGHVETSQLYDGAINTQEYTRYLDKLKKIKPSAGVKICIAADKPLIGHGGVILTPYARRVNGINEVTNIDPSLAPQGKHFAVAHQCVEWDRLDDLEQEIDLGLKDIEDIFAGEKYEVLLIQSHSNGWPVNRSASGLDIGNRTPIPNLYVVGDGAKGKGGIEVEGVALGVANTMKMILD